MADLALYRAAVIISISVVIIIEQAIKGSGLGLAVRLSR